MEKNKSRSVVDANSFDILKRISYLENQLSVYESDFVDYCCEYYGLVADGVYVLVDKAIDFGIQNNDVDLIKTVMHFYGLFKSYSKSLYEIKLLECRLNHE